MNISGSECSSGCQSGWTTYFDQYSNSADQYNRSLGRVHGDEDHRGKLGFCSEDEDLSMVSDASSGPPHFRDDDEYLYSAAEQYKGKQKRKSKEIWGDKQNCYLDDTASSPALSFPYKENTASMENVPGVSEKHLKGKSVLGKHFGFLKSSNKSGKAASLKSGGMKGRK